MNVPIDLVRDLARTLGPGPGTVRIVLGLAAALLVATVVRGVAVRARPTDEARGRWRSLGTWWMLLVLLVLVVLLGRPAAVVVMAGISLLALREGIGLAGVEAALASLAVPVLAVYAWAWLDGPSLFTRALPGVAVLCVAGELAWRLRLRPRFTRAHSVALAFLACVLGPSYVVAVASLPAAADLPPTPMGWFLLLAVLTELNDIAQALWGRALGSRPLAPVLSPRKTREGLYGGVATTVAASVLLAPMVTSYGRVAPEALGAWGPPWVWSAALGLAVALAGTGGDLLASRLKRRAGVRHSGDLLPGHGGVLDRVDSLAATAPTFFFLTWVLWGGSW